MKTAEQRMKELCEAGRAKGKITLAVEKAYESICPAPARDYLEEKYQELLYLRGMVYRKDYDDPMWYKPEILNKYGIDHKGPRETVLKQVEKAYRELDARFCRMTGKKSGCGRAVRQTRDPESGTGTKGGIRKQRQRGPYAQAWRQKAGFLTERDRKGNLFRKTKLKKTRK